MKIFLNSRRFPPLSPSHLPGRESGQRKSRLEQINVPEGEHSTDAYLAKNPYGTVPTLELYERLAAHEVASSE